MKAEHRKELERNVLRDQVSHVAQTLKSRPSNGIIAFWVILLLVVLGYGAWRYFSVSSGRKTSDRWTKLDEISNVADLAPFVQANAGTNAARTARFEEARYHLQHGVENLGAPEQHDNAVKELIASRQQYEELAPLSRDMPVLKQEALMGHAKTEEALSATPNPENPSEMLGSLDRAVQLYTQLKDEFPDTFQGKSAEARIKEIQEKRDKIQAFYTALNKQVSPVAKK